MAKVKFEVPELTGEITIPGLKEDAAAAVRSHIAKEKDMVALGFPGELVPDWKEKAVAKFDELLEKYRSLKVFMDICVKCGACTDKCQFYLGTRTRRICRWRGRSFSARFTAATLRLREKCWANCPRQMT